LEIPQNLRDFNSLVRIIAILRGPEGCPWGQEADPSSLREHLLEESYEVLEGWMRKTAKSCAPSWAICCYK
jgi:tetrapyrrole methylase family protein/MazG family protein